PYPDSSQTVLPGSCHDHCILKIHKFTKSDSSSYLKRNNHIRFSKPLSRQIYKRDQRKQTGENANLLKIRHLIVQIESKKTSNICYGNMLKITATFIRQVPKQ
ncbi:hypothetical protein Ancab_003695, partial [Ancistrocladus abbreviatus]